MLQIGSCCRYASSVCSMEVDVGIQMLICAFFGYVTGLRYTMCLRALQDDTWWSCGLATIPHCAAEARFALWQQMSMCAHTIGTAACQGTHRLADTMSGVVRRSFLCRDGDQGRNWDCCHNCVDLPPRARCLVYTVTTPGVELQPAVWTKSPASGMDWFAGVEALSCS